MRRFLAVTLSAAMLTGALSITAMAADDPTIDDIYTAAKAGRLEQAQSMIEQVLRDHPNSAKAHFVQAELFAREGKASQARSELARAEQIKPDDSFASARAVQELKSELGVGGQRAGNTTMMMQREAPAPHFPWGTVIVLALVIGVLWMIFRRRSTAVPYSGAPSVVGGPSYGGPGPGYGPGYGPPPAGGGTGSGIAGGLASGLAVGAGVVAGEELAHHFLDGGRREGAPPPQSDDSGWQSTNNDMGGSDFGVSDSGGGWDDSSGGGGGGGGGDDWT